MPTWDDEAVLGDQGTAAAELAPALKLHQWLPSEAPLVALPQREAWAPGLGAGAMQPAAQEELFIQQEFPVEQAALEVPELFEQPTQVRTMQPQLLQPPPPAPPQIALQLGASWPAEPLQQRALLPQQEQQAQRCAQLPPRQSVASRLVLPGWQSPVLMESRAAIQVGDSAFPMQANALVLTIPRLHFSIAFCQLTSTSILLNGSRRRQVEPCDVLQAGFLTAEGLFAMDAYAAVELTANFNL
jgi:hypothetical protein